MLVLGDSLPFPRPLYHKAARIASQTWPSLLMHKQEFTTLWLRAQGQSTSRQVVIQARRLRPYLGQDSVRLTVIQCGIVDAAPRPYPYWLRTPMESLTAKRITARLPKDKQPHRNQTLLKAWGHPWVSPEVYRRNITTAVRSLAGISEETALVEIQAPGKRMLEILGPFTVDPYNDALRDIASREGVRFVPFTAELTDDGHHLTASDHERLATALRRNHDQ